MKRLTNTLIKALVLFISIGIMASSVFVNAKNIVMCPTGAQLAKLKVEGPVTTGWYYTHPALVDKHKCAVAWSIFAPSKERAQAALANAKQCGRPVMQGRFTVCKYSQKQIAGNWGQMGMINVLVYAPVKKSCSSKALAIIGNISTIGS